MKAKTIDNRPFGWNAVVYDNEDSPMIFALNELVNKHDAVGITESFNLELSAHVSKETEQLLAEIDRLKKDVERLKNISDDECVHENVDQKSLRCTICVDCGKIIDVID